MTLAPLTTGPHLVPANRLAFTTPVREAGGAGHWVTIHGGDEAEPGGGVHIFISSGGVVAKGPHGLLGHHIGAVASHPSVSKAQHHPVGHEPPGARDHPHYAEAPPKPPVAPGDAGSGADTAAKRPGKPYARLSGAEQGTRQEQIGKALGAAQEAARGAKAKPSAPPAEQAGKKGTFGERREATVKAMQEKEPGGLPRYRVLGVSDDQTTCDICGKKDLKRTVALHHEVSGDVVRAGSDCAADLLRTSRGSIEKAAKQHGEKRDAAIEKALESHPNQEIIKRFASKIDRITQYHRGQKSEPSATEQAGVAHARQRIAELTAEARRDIEKQLPQDKPLPQSEVEQRVVHGRTVRTEKPAAPFSAPNAERQTPNAIADTAVAHQQAQADLAAHRASADRNPNPWAPHLSPPVGDAKDRELQEKATRAQLAHQAASAQQQGAQQAEQQEGQRAHEKEMVRLKAPQQQSTPGHTLESVSADVERHKAHVLDEHPDLKAFLGHAEQHNAARPKRFEERIDTQHHEKWLATEARARLRPEQRTAAGIPARMAQRFGKPAVPSPATPKGEAGPAFTAPQAKEKPQTAPQPEQVAGAPAISDEQRARYSHMTYSPEGRATLRDLAAKAQAVGGHDAEDAKHLAGLQRELERHSALKAGGKAQNTAAYNARTHVRNVAQHLVRHDTATTQQAQQGTGARAASPEHRQTLEAGKSLLKRAALDPATHQRKVAAAVDKALASDPYDRAVRGYARHGAEYAQRLAHLEAAGHYQSAADDLSEYHDQLSARDRYSGGTLGQAARHIDDLTHIQQRVGEGPMSRAAQEQINQIHKRSSAITDHYMSARQRLQEKADEHRAAHRRLSGQSTARECAHPPSRFVAPAAG